MAVKRRRNRGRINLSSRENGNYEGYTRDDIDPDQANTNYQLQL